ncbi:class I adenylate-forming enzyme family protein [Tsukamurella pulmonis]|uniref:class I adenylate-forming enzyme family protein n=1 Tax=Tsukamurella pulmonis TaxID=47312 RepID=UPI000A3FDDB8
MRVFPGAGIVAMYGTTECKRISVLPPEEYAAAPESVGHPIDGLRVRIDPGTSEIVVRGATLMDGYWNDDAATAHRYRRDPATGERELWTGDTGRIDADGRLYVDGRLDDVFKRRGVRVSLTEVEAAALRVPTVRAAVAARSGERLFLFVVADTPVAALGRDLAARLDPPRRPDRIVAVASIPLNPNGKADRAALVRAITAPPIDEEITA